ncbi:MAG: 50S ribosomal protein L28 [Nitrospirae bacterium]|nr:MAG: 50S ribosomal protein L28 [Nitrospirota bacterium]
MAVCYSCGKQRTVGNNVSHSNKKTKRVLNPNLQRIKIQTDKGPRREFVCTRCIRSGRVKKVI